MFNANILVAKILAVFIAMLHRSSGTSFVGLIALIVAHVGAALYHQFVMKDNLIARMK